MNKRLVTLAVAAALASPVAAMADATIYGKLNVSIDYANVDDVIAPTYSPTGKPIAPNYNGEDFNGWGVAKGNGYIPGSSRANRIGIKGSEDLGGGLKAIYQVEFGINPEDTNNNVVSGANSITMRNTFVGLAGGWGTFVVGRHDTPLKISTAKLDLFADTMADYNGTVGFNDIRADNAIAYISPSFAGFQLAGAMVAPGGATATGNTNINSDSIAEGWSLAGIYTNGPFYASLAYENLGNELFMNTTTSQASGSCNVTSIYYNPVYCGNVGDDFTKWRVGLGILDWNGFTLTAIYENQDNLPGGDTYSSTLGYVPGYVVLPDGPDSAELWQIEAAYSFGNNTIKAMYGQQDRDGSFAVAPSAPFTGFERGQISDYYDGNRSTWAIGFDHDFSKRTKVYALYVNVDDDWQGLDAAFGVTGAQWDGFSLGMMHSF